MSSITFFYIFVCIIAILFLAINLILAPHNPYNEKISAFECGFHSFLQTRSPFNISFFIFGIVYLLLDLEILFIFPFSVSAYNSEIYGIASMFVFAGIVTLGFLFELAKGALELDNSKIDNFSLEKKSVNSINYLGGSIFWQDTPYKFKEDLNKGRYPNELKSKNIKLGGQNIKDVGKNINQWYDIQVLLSKTKNLQVKGNNYIKALYSLGRKFIFTDLKKFSEFPFMDLKKLYLIPKDFFEKYIFYILSILAILFTISLFINIFLFKVDISFYYGILTIVLSLVISLVIVSFLKYRKFEFKDWKDFFKGWKDFFKNWKNDYKYWKNTFTILSINSIYIMSNILLISLFLTIFIYILAHYLSCFDTLSFKTCWFYSRNIIGILLTLKLMVHIYCVIDDNKGNTKKLLHQLSILILSLLVLAFFYKIIYYIWSPLDLLVLSWTTKNVLNTESKLNIPNIESKLNIPNIESKLNIPNIESKLNIPNIESKLDITDKSLNYIKGNPLAVNAKGLFIYPPDGREVFDAASGAAVASIGYGDEQVLKAIGEKYQTGAHYLASSRWIDSDVLKLNEKLIQSTGGLLAKSYLTGSGSDATEAALKLARQYHFDKDNETTREYFIGRDHSYHGNTLAALSVSEFHIRQAPFIGILLKSVDHVSSCYAYHQQAEGESDADFVAKKAVELENKILKLGKDKVIAFIMEPVVGAALGCVPYVPGYLKAMQDVCHKYDVLLIFDEIMCGMGRTGTLHAWQAEGVVPDIQIIGKGLGAGYHSIAAILVSSKVCEALKNEQFIHGLTFDAAPVAAVAALEVQKVVEDNHLLENVSKLGDYIKKSLIAKLGDHPNVGDIRGKGLFLGIEFVENKITKEPLNPELRVVYKIINLAISPEFNMTLYPSTGIVDGVRGDSIIIAPPFNYNYKILGTYCIGDIYCYCMSL